MGLGWAQAKTPKQQGHIMILKIHCTADFQMLRWRTASRGVARLRVRVSKKTGRVYMPYLS